MKGLSCIRCGCGVLVRGPISLGCPVCGERSYLPDADERMMWSEHRLGLMYRRGGWRFMDVFDPPAWFVGNVV